MNNKVYLDNTGTTVIEVVGDQDVASIERMGRETSTLITEQRTLGKPCLVLDNILQIGAVGPEGRKKVVELAQTLDFDKCAMVGKGGMMRFGANLMLRATGRSYKLRYFDNIHEADMWLRK